MISLYTVRRYCKDFHLIKNYEKAINDDTQTWHCHHILEESGYSGKDLMNLGLYYNRPPEELIFLTPFEHKQLHGLNMSDETKEKKRKSMMGKNKGINHPMYGKAPWNKGKKTSEEQKQKLSKSHKNTHRVYDNPEHTKWHMEKN